jgi:hypothetical protein
MKRLLLIFTACLFFQHLHAQYTLITPGSVISSNNNLSTDEYTSPKVIAYSPLGNLNALASYGTDIVNGIALANPNDPANTEYYVTGNARFYAPLSNGNLDGYFLTKFSATPWQTKVANATGTDVAVDANGNVYTTGWLSSGANFGNGVLTVNGGLTAFLAKHDANGQFQWVRLAGSSGIDMGRALAIDASGNVFMTGFFMGDDLGITSTNGNTTGLPYAGGRDIFVAKFDPNGNLLWARQAGGVGDDEPKDIATDGSQVFVGGFFANTCSFGNFSKISNGGTDFFLTKYNSSGTEQWAMSGGGTADDAINGLVATSGGYGVVITGYFSNLMSLNTVNGSTLNLNSAGGKDIFVGIINDPSGSPAVQMMKRAGGEEDDMGTKIALVGNGTPFVSTLLVTGLFRGSANFNGPSLVTNSDNGCGFLAAFTTHGHYLWGKALAKTAWSYTTDIANPPFSLRPYIVGVVGPYGANGNSGGLPANMAFWKFQP